MTKILWLAFAIHHYVRVFPLQMDLPSCDTYRLSSLLRSLGELSPRTDVMFMIMLSWGEVSPSYRLCMYYFPSIYFLSLISESCYHFNLCCTAIIIMISITTVHKHMQKHRRTLLFRYKHFIINFWVQFFNTRRETIFKSLLKSYYANNTATLSTSHGPISISQHHDWNSTSTVCHWRRQPNCQPTLSKVNSQLTLFQNLQILRTITFGHDAIHTPAPFPIWGFLWQWWLSYPLRTSIKLYPISVPWTKSRIIQSPTKLNDKI